MTCDDAVVEASIVGVWRTPIGWGAYGGRRGRRRVRIGAPDPALTPVSGMLAVTELVDRLDVIGRLDAAIGSIKQRRRGLTGEVCGVPDT